MGSAGSETPSRKEPGLLNDDPGLLLREEQPGVVYESPLLVVRRVLRA
jgi:hypothetical protein